MDIHHPLIRSVLLPLAVALLATGLLRGLLGAHGGRRWATAGLGLALLVASLAVVGWRAQPGTLTEKLPWVIAAALLLGLVLDAVRARAVIEWAAASALWAVVLVLLGVPSLLSGLATWAVGAVVISAVARQSPDSANAPALLAVTLFGLAGVAMMASSLLLFELTLGAAVATAGAALWLWPRARVTLGAAGRVPALLALLALGHATLRLTQAPVGALLLLAAACVAGGWIGAWRERRGSVRAWAAPLWRAAGTGVLAGAAVAMTLSATTAAPGAAGAPDDAYYTPRW